MNKITLGRKLKKKFAVVSTGGPVSPQREMDGLATINSLGYESSQAYSCSKFYGDYAHGFANGSATMRIEAIKQCLLDNEVDCLLAARGATGSLEIIEHVPFDLWAEQKKILIGKSDVTSLLVQMPFRSGIPAIHGATLGGSFADYNNSPDAKESIDSLIQMLTNKDYRQVYHASSVIKQELAEPGFLLAGNLTMLVSLLGSEFDVDYTGSILLLEEVGDAPFRVQRMLNQFYLAGKFKNLKGLCFGRFSKCEAKAGPNVSEVIDNFCNERLKSSKFPILKGLEVGHWGKNLPVPIGCQAIIRDSALHQLESPIS